MQIDDFLDSFWTVNMQIRSPVEQGKSRNQANQAKKVVTRCKCEMNTWLILENLILFLRNCTCVPSPQSIRNNRFLISKTCDVGLVKVRGVAA